MKTQILLIYLANALSVFLINAEKVDINLVELSENQAKLEISSEEKNYNLKLSKKYGPSEVFHPNFEYLTLKTNENGETEYEKYIPTENDWEEIQKNLYVDEINKAAIFIDSKSKEKTILNGIIQNSYINTNSEGGHTLKEMKSQRQDYINVDQDFYENDTISTANADANNIVEHVLVVDKEFGDIFNHNKNAILQYLTVYYWDINMRYKTLSDIRLSWQLNSVVAIRDTNSQPFIENARGSDGRAEFGRILVNYFTRWVYDQMGRWPAFDLAALITSTNLEWGGGLAYVRTVCAVNHDEKKHYGTAVWNDGGNWDSLTVGAHELGHNLAMPHDDDDNYPGGCSERGYIMAGGTEEKQWFFSSCSNRVTTEYVNSNGGNCLRELRHRNPEVNPLFTSPLAPNMEEQCRRLRRNQNARINRDDTSNCKSFRCEVPVNGGWSISRHRPVDNTLCGNNEGRCLRGECRNKARLFRHRPSNLCMRAGNPTNHMVRLEMIDCPNSAYASLYDSFSIRIENNGNKLATPWWKHPESGDRCVWTGNRDGDALWTDRCDPRNDWHGFELRDVGSGFFMMVHRVSGRCARPESNNSGSPIITNACNRDNNNFHWRQTD